MKKTIIILALIGATLTGFSQALPSGSVPFGEQVWIAPDGSIWVGKNGNGYKQVLYLNSSATLQEIETAVQFVSPGSLRVPTPTSGAQAANRDYVDNAISASLSDLTVAWADITAKPSTFTPSAHTHAAADIVSGTLSTARIPNLNASKITAGTFGIARIPTGTTGTTVALGNHTHPIADITSLQTTLNGKASLSGATFSGEVTFSDRIFVPTPIGNNDAADKEYVDFVAKTDLSAVRNSSQVTVVTENPEASDAIILPATSSNAGVMTAADKKKLDSISAVATLSAPRTYYVFDGILDNQTDTTLLEVDLQQDGYWNGDVADEGWRIEFKIIGNFANSGIDNRLSLWIGAPGSYTNLWNKNILGGTIPAQDFWITGVITKIGANTVRVEIDFMTGDPGGVDSHSISFSNVSGAGEWSFESGPPVQLELSTNFTDPGSVLVGHARFTQFPLNGTYDTNF